MKLQKFSRQKLRFVLCESMIFYHLWPIISYNKGTGIDFFTGSSNPKASMADANKAWAELSVEMKEEYKKRAFEVELPSFSELSVEGQKSKIFSIRKKIAELVSN